MQRGFPHLIDHVRTGRSEFFTADQVTKFDIGEAERGWNIAKGAIASSLYSVVVLDELNPVLDLGMLDINEVVDTCLLYTSPSPRDLSTSRMPSSA